MSIIIVLSLIAILFLIGRLNRLVSKIENNKVRWSLGTLVFIGTFVSLYFFGVYVNPTFAEVAVAWAISFAVDIIEYLIKRKQMTADVPADVAPEAA